MSYLNKDTTTPGKLRSTEWARIRSKCGPGLSVYLVGSPLCLERHIEDKKRLGFTDLSNHIIVERDLDTYRELSDWCSELYPKVHVFNGDFMEILKSITEHVAHVDFDSVEAFSSYSEELIRLSISRSVDNIHVVNSTRSGNSCAYMAEKAVQLGIPFIRKWGNRRWIEGPPLTKHMIPHILKPTLNGYSVETMSYKSIGQNRGGQSMVMTVLNRG